jgi:hypothetical protein
MVWDEGFGSGCVRRNMANFNTHVNVAFAASGLAGLVLFEAGILSAPMFVTCVLMGTIGGLLPDLDSDNSTPLTVGFTVFAMFIAFGAVIWLGTRLMLFELIGLWALTFAFVRYGIFRLFTALTVHRGVMHSVPYALLFGVMAVMWCGYGLGMPAKNSWLIGSFVSFGALIHLTLDELYSVNLTNMALKRSFGTALTLFTLKDKFWYMGLYSVLIAALAVAPSSDTFRQSVMSPEAWQMLGERLVRWP